MDQAQIEEFKKDVLAFSGKLSEYDHGHPKYILKVRHIISVFNKIAAPSPGSYAEKCPYCTELYSDRIVKYYNLGHTPEHIIDDLFGYAIRFTKEFILRENNYTTEDVEILNFYKTIDNSQLSEIELKDSVYLDICFDKLLIGTETDKLKSLLEHTSRDLATLDTWGEKIEKYQNELKKQYLDYNFVALSRAFVYMLNNSNKTLNSQRDFLLLVGTTTLLIPFTTFILSAFKIAPDIFISPLIYLPIATVTIILIYYFRVILHHYNNTKAQCLQLELRQAICCFAEAYHEYKKDNPHAINDKFENLIFSSIALNPDKIPGTFDGLEQLTNLIKTCTKGK